MAAGAPTPTRAQRCADRVNLCYRANREPFHQHYGRNNVVRNNILAYGGESLLAYVQEEHVGVIFECNILLSDDKPFSATLPGALDAAPDPLHRNLTGASQPQFGRDNNENQWDGIGRTIRRLADPLFVDPRAAIACVPAPGGTAMGCAV